MGTSARQDVTYLPYRVAPERASGARARKRLSDTAAGITLLLDLPKHYTRRDRTRPALPSWRTDRLDQLPAADPRAGRHVLLERFQLFRVFSAWWFTLVLAFRRSDHRCPDGDFACPTRDGRAQPRGQHGTQQGGGRIADVVDRPEWSTHTK